MRVVGISDTHSYHRKVIVPDGDVFVHCGDITWRGEMAIIADFSNWLSELPHKHKIVIFGNHEVGFENGPNRNAAIDLIRVAGANYLEDSGIEIEGKILWGSPITKYYMDWEWNRFPGQDIKYHWNKIPDTTDILITHGPNYNILDDTTENGHQGDKDLLERVWQLKNLQLHLFGHLHRDGCSMEEINGIKFANCSVLDDAYKLHNRPINVIDI
jgi:predicted phosphohydrolase